ncbi:alpha/beta hydrolase [Dactylosporangium sp. NPDC005572]|uniref:alpha/beta fold hydrolase n=1 Tax=Dactylosporangium sp. NPDC005572 TaxID=3156889 RepID=UPI0033B0B952
MTIPGGTLFTTSSGTFAQPAALMVHSGIANSQMWFPLMDALGDAYFSVAYDCRCFGRSTTTLDGTFSDIDDLASALDAYDLDTAVLVGESRGARLVLDFVLTHPERVRGIFLLAPDIGGFDRPVADHERPLMDAIGAAEDAWVVEDIIAGELRLLVDGAGREEAEGRAAVRASVAEMSRVNYAQQKDTPDFTSVEPPAAGRLAEITCPVRVLVGDADTVGTQAMAEAIERTCPDASLVRVPDTAHALTLERPDVVERELRHWLRDFRQ